MFRSNVFRGVTALTQAAVATAVLASTASGQLPATPVLQNAFANPGLAFAGNYGGGGGQSFFGLAGAWGLGGGRLQVSGAAGAQRGNGATRGAYGGRAAANVWTSRGGSLGAGAFVGVGGAPRTEDAGTVTNAAVLIVPAGVSIGYRRPFGATRGISAYASPMYRWTRADDGAVTTSGTLRFAFGVDFAISQTLGVTAGGELGRSNASRGSGGGTLGVAVTFVPGRR
jgi:hypothetical protein